MRVLSNRSSIAVRFLGVITVVFIIFVAMSWLNPVRNDWNEGTLFYLPLLVVGLIGNGGILFLVVRYVRNKRTVENVVLYGSIIIVLAMMGSIVVAATRSEYRWILHENAMQWPGSACGLVIGWVRRRKNAGSNSRRIDTLALRSRLVALVLDLCVPSVIQIVASLIGVLVFPERIAVFSLLGTAAAYVVFVALRSRENGSLGEHAGNVRVVHAKTGEIGSSWQRAIRAGLVVLWPIELLVFAIGVDRTIAERISGTNVEIVRSKPG